MFSKIKQNFKHYLSGRLLLNAVLVLAMIAVTCLILTAAACWEITIIDDGNVMQIKTRATTVGEVLSEAGIILAPEDVCSVGVDAPVSQVDNIQIKRAFPLTLVDQAGKKLIRTTGETVGEVLEQQGIVLDENDEVEPALDAKAEPESEIFITRVDVVEVTDEQTLGFKTVRQSSDRLEKGKTKVITEGKNGVAKVTYQVTIKNGKETARNEVSREIIKAPVDKVVAVGTKVPQPKAVTTMASRSSSVNIRGARVIICRATAYDGSYETLGKHNPKTALGRKPTVGTVAVDPSIIPLGTRLYIETVDGSWSYGECFAGDTGVKGYHVDLFMNSRSEALRFGSRQVRVYILD